MSGDARRDHGSARKHQRAAAKAAHRARKRSRAADRERDRIVTERHGREGHGSCGRKNRYRTERDALSTALRAMRRGAPPLWVYRCSLCGGWHLTSHPRGGLRES